MIKDFFAVIYRTVMYIVTMTSSGMWAENMEWFTEDQTFSPSYDLAPPTPLLPPLRSVSSTGDTQEDWEREIFADGRGGKVGVGEEPNHTTARKPGPL